MSVTFNWPDPNKCPSCGACKTCGHGASVKVWPYPAYWQWGTSSAPVTSYGTYTTVNSSGVQFSGSANTFSGPYGSGGPGMYS